MSVLGRHQRWRKQASVFAALQATATGGDDISSTAWQQLNNHSFSATSDVMLSANSTPAFQQQFCLHPQQQFVNFTISNRASDKHRRHLHRRRVCAYTTCDLCSFRIYLERPKRQPSFTSTSATSAYLHSRHQRDQHLRRDVPKP